MARERRVLWFGIVALVCLLAAGWGVWGGWLGGGKVSIESAVAGYKLEFGDKEKVEDELTRLGAWQKNGVGFPRGNDQVERGEIRHLTVTLVGDKLPYGRSRYYGYNFGKEGRGGGRLEIWVDLSKPEMVETLVNGMFQRL